MFKTSPRKMVFIIKPSWHYANGHWLGERFFYWLLLFPLIDSTIGNVELFHSGVATVIIGG